MAELELSCPAAPSDTGAYRLSWRGPDKAVYHLTETAGGDARVIYEGPDTATTVTGRAAGSYRYRLELAQPAVGLQTAAGCDVDVAPPSLTLALGVFGLGLIITLATAVLIGRGHRRHRRGEIG